MLIRFTEEFNLRIVTLQLFFLQPFFKHHMIEKVPELDSDYSINGEVSFSTSSSVSYTRIIKRIWHYGVSIFLIFFISLAVYPAVTVLVESEYKGKGHAWNGNLKFMYHNALKISNKLYGYNLKWFFRHIFCTCGYVPYLQYRRLCRKNIMWYSSMGENLRFKKEFTICKYSFVRCLSSFYHCSQKASHGS